MNFKIGDKIRLLNEKGEGTVSRIITKTTVGVTLEDGFEIPYPAAELVLIYDKTKAGEPVIKAEAVFQTFEVPVSDSKTSHKKKAEPKGIYIAFSPEKINDITHSDMNAWLINNTEYSLLFTYSLFQNGNFITLETGTAKAHESLLIETIDRKELADFSNFKIDALFFDGKEHKHLLPVSELVKLKPIKLYKENAFTVNSFISEKALIMNVWYMDNSFEEEPNYESKADLSKILFQKKHHSETAKKSKPNASNNPAAEMEINLHIEELIDNYEGMSNAEIVIVQLKHFQNALDTAVNEHFRKLVVIHGVGNGRLKQEVRNILASHKNLQFYDASYSKYGFGATEILIS